MHADHLLFLASLSAQTMGDLGRALKEGNLRFGYSTGALQPYVGKAQCVRVHEALTALEADGMPLAGIAAMCQALSLVQHQKDEALRQTLLTLSGPGIPGVPVFDTQALVNSLFHEATREVLITSYVFHSAGEILQPLAKKHDEDDGFRVRVVVDLSHRRTRARSDYAQISSAFLKEFRERHWQGDRLPEIWDDPRQFAGNGAGVMHAKVIVIDRITAFVTSANFTEAALTRNIEAGVMIRQPRFAERLTTYFEGLMSKQLLRRVV
jgi:phosphatidylserine/phosphatidylglycerophosphate/cardiolipin synthase-like enzyme